jgi:hypothetical protein
MRSFRSRRDAAAAGVEALLRRVPALPADWHWQEPMQTNEHDHPATPDAEAQALAAAATLTRNVDVPVGHRLVNRAQECPRWHAEEVHDQHTWHDTEHGPVACPGLRAAPDQERRVGIVGTAGSAHPTLILSTCERWALRDPHVSHTFTPPHEMTEMLCPGVRRESECPSG